jgi:hypothetical protein
MVTAASRSSKLLLADDSTRLFFSASTEFAGEISDVITFRAWDSSDFVNETTANVSQPLNPVRVGSYNTSGNANEVVLSSDGRFAYVADFSSMVRSLNGSRVGAPACVTTTVNVWVTVALSPGVSRLL